MALTPAIPESLRLPGQSEYYMTGSDSWPS